MTVSLIAILMIAVIPVVLVERRRQRRSATRRPWSGYSPAVLYTRGGEPRFGLVGRWDNSTAARRAKRRWRARERRGAR